MCCFFEVFNGCYNNNHGYSKADSHKDVAVVKIRRGHTTQC